MLKLCDHLSNSAKNIGAVNTVKILENGKIFGHNSDGEGFINNLLNHFPQFNFKSSNNLVIGAGGASRAIIYSLIKQRVGKIYIANRSTKNLQIIIDHFQNFARQNHVELIAVELKNQYDFFNQIDLIINTSSLGMQGCEPLDINLENVKKTAVIYDIVYKPLYTKLLQDAKKNNLPIITGVGMLIHQALIGFEMWFNTKPEYSLELEKTITEIANL